MTRTNDSGAFADHGHDTTKEDAIAADLVKLVDRARASRCCPDCIAALLLGYVLAMAKHVLDEDPYAWVSKEERAASCHAPGRAAARQQNELIGYPGGYFRLLDVGCRDRPHPHADN
jgi:hypothetical protein